MVASRTVVQALFWPRAEGRGPATFGRHPSPRARLRDWPAQVDLRTIRTHYRPATSLSRGSGPWPSSFEMRNRRSNCRCRLRRSGG